MPQPVANIVDALSGEEVCPLCFDHYSSADACVCSVCRVASCPSCNESLDRDYGAVRCFACRPLTASAPSATQHGPLALPRPIYIAPAARADGLPPLPFPLTTSPQGVRTIKRQPPGSVFVGLPPLARGLAQTLDAAPKGAPRFVRLAPRARIKWQLISRAFVLVSRASDEIAVLVARGSARFEPFARASALRLQARAHALFESVRERLPAYARALKTAWHAVQPKLRAALHWLEAHGEQLAKRAAARFPRLTRSKSSLVRPDPSRPIHL